MGNIGAADSAFFGQIRRTARIYIVRHGQSEGNARLVIQGRIDSPLDASGRAQAAAAGAWLAGQKVSAVLSSPLVRAAETASIVASACALPGPSLDPVFMELDTGMFSGLSLDDAKERFPDIYAAFRSKSWDGVPDAEASPVIYERAMSAWTLIRKRVMEGEGAIACVTHGGFIQWLVRATFGCRSWMPLLPTGNCGIFELLVEPAGEGEGAYMHWRLLNFQAASAIKAVPQVF
jgi:broad specificity phosphatase PhoE